MRIGIFDGSIEFEGGSIRRKVSRQSSLTLLWGAKLGRNSSTGSGGILPSSRNMESFRRLFLRSNTLETVLIAVGIPTDKTGEWTRELELERKSMHDAWLRASLENHPTFTRGAQWLRNWTKRASPVR